MYPHERSLVNEHKDSPFAIIGVNSDSDRESIQKVAAEKDLTWRSFWNGPEGIRGPISTRWNVEGWPTTYLIDAKGIIRHKQIFGEQLDGAIAQLLGEIKDGD